jgi:CopG family nickel-responsive transcriptional regulator
MDGRVKPRTTNRGDPDFAGASSRLRLLHQRLSPAISGHLMQRVTITLDDELMTELDQIIAARGYQNRSEAIRDLARSGIRQAAETLGKQRDCVAALVYVYDHNARQLSKRLADTFHDHHELSLASIHAHLDHESCMEVTILRGKTDKVQHFAEHVIAERGVHHGRLVLVPTDVMIKPHSHEEKPHQHPHPRKPARK